MSRVAVAVSDEVDAARGGRGTAEELAIGEAARGAEESARVGIRGGMIGISKR